MRAHLAALLFASCVAAVAAPARAQPSAEARQRAADRFEEARGAFAHGDYARAADKFEQAAAIVPHPATFMNAAEAWERAGEIGRAAELCDRIVATPYAEPRYVDTASAMLRRLGPKISTLDVLGPRGARAGIDGGPEVSVPHRWRLRPGAHQLVVAAEQRARKIPLDLAAGETRALDPDVAPEPRPPAASPPPPTPAPLAPTPAPAPEPAEASSSSAVPWVFFGVAGAGAVVGGVFGLMTLKSRTDYEAVPNKTTADGFYKNRTIANVGFVTAGAAALVGVLFVLLAPSRARAAAWAPPALMGRVTF